MSHFRNNNPIPSVDLGDGPFVFSESHNIFTVAGCGTAAILEDREVISGCSTTCNNDTTIDESILCFGINCCQTKIRHDIKSYSVDITRLKKKCEAGGSAFLVDKNSKQGRFPGEFVFKGDNSFIPISLMWILTNNDFNNIPNRWKPAESNPNSLFLGNNSYVDLRKCSCGMGRVGNPYLHYQCEGMLFCIIYFLPGTFTRILLVRFCHLIRI